MIQKAVQDPLAEMILAGRIKDGEAVTISAGKQGLTFNGKRGGRGGVRLGHVPCARHGAKASDALQPGIVRQVRLDGPGSAAHHSRVQRS